VQSNRAVVLKLFSLRRFRKSLLDLRRTSNTVSVIIKFLFIDEKTKRHMHHFILKWCLFLHNVSRILEWNCHPHFPLKAYSWLAFGFNHGHDRKSCFA